MNVRGARGAGRGARDGNQSTHHAVINGSATSRMEASQDERRDEDDGVISG